MLRRILAVILSVVSSFLLVLQSSAQRQPEFGRGGDANILSPKLCFSLQIPGNWVPGEDSGSYISPDRKQFVRVMPVDVKDLKNAKGNTLIEKEGELLVRIHEKAFHQKLTGVMLAPFSTRVQGTWKWFAAPVREKNREVPVAPRYLVDRGPEGIIVVEIDGTPDNDALAQNIFATLKASNDQPCPMSQLIQDMKDLAKGVNNLPSEPRTIPPTPNDLDAPARLFKNPAVPWFVHYPGNWQINAVDPRRIFITHPGFGDPAGCEIMSVPVEFKALDEFADFWLRQTAEYMASQGGRVRRTDRLRITLPNGIEGIDVRSEIPGGGRSRTVFALVDGVGYIIDCVTSVNSWESFAPVFARIIGSFSIEKKQ